MPNQVNLPLPGQGTLGVRSSQKREVEEGGYAPTGSSSGGLRRTTGKTPDASKKQKTPDPSGEKRSLEDQELI